MCGVECLRARGPSYKKCPSPLQGDVQASSAAAILQTEINVGGVFNRKRCVGSFSVWPRWAPLETKLRLPARPLDEGSRSSFQW